MINWLLQRFEVCADCGHRCKRLRLYDQIDGRDFRERTAKYEVTIPPELSPVRPLYAPLYVQEKAVAWLDVDAVACVRCARVWLRPVAVYYVDTRQRKLRLPRHEVTLQQLDSLLAERYRGQWLPQLKR